MTHYTALEMRKLKALICPSARRVYELNEIPENSGSSFNSTKTYSIQPIEREAYLKITEKDLY